jgi:hypothetical protein
MTKPTIRIYDCETGETIDREMNDVEFAQYQTEKETALQRQAEAAAKATQKAALLERLGISEDEARLLLA